MNETMAKLIKKKSSQLQKQYSDQQIKFSDKSLEQIKQQVQQDCYSEYANWFRLARAVVKEMEIMRDDGEDNEAIMLNEEINVDDQLLNQIEKEQQFYQQQQQQQSSPEKIQFTSSALSSIYQKNKLGYKISVDTVARSIALGLLKMLGEQNPLFKGRSQQDSHEALLSILDALHEVSTDKAAATGRSNLSTAQQTHNKQNQHLAFNEAVRFYPCFG
ncbi:MAG: hypothetical protein EZS28_003256 [Streblomastix strix]|uniref:Uncharacterized protein n=1 Tax=Streblomastix strix TaxID=222440 RepID=A0A5J4X372_9EUKA|nr:MAG: hypothetical protein EZS28_003256 [Streblomastix strix]